MNRELVALAEKDLHRFLGEMAMPRAHIHYQRVRSCGLPGQRFAEAGVYAREIEETCSKSDFMP